MLIDIGMATVFVAGGLLAAFVATGVLTREIENKTALTVISKPVGRPLFVLGKFLGVAGALILLSTLYMSFVFLLVELALGDRDSARPDPPSGDRRSASARCVIGARRTPSGATTSTGRSSRAP